MLERGVEWQLRVENLERKNRLLEEELHQAERIRQLWDNAVRELKAARTELKTSREFLSRVLMSIPDPVLVADSRGRITLANPAAEGLSGLPSQPLSGRRILRLLVPGDRKRVLRRCREGLRDGDGEFFIQGPQGVRCIFARWTVLYGSRGEIIQTTLVATDITARKQAEEALEVAASVYQAVGEAIMIADANNRIIAVNPAFTRLTGYTAEEAVGRDTGLLKTNRQDKAFYQRMWESLKTIGHWQGEIWNRRKNGEEYLEWLEIHTIHDADGEVLRRIAIFSDITDKKKAAETIWRQANYDPLTGLPNRHLFLDRLQQEIRKGQRSGQSLALLFIDLDRFKEVNDILGHEAGDLLLVEAAHRISGPVRNTDTVARLGGDEFTVVMPELSDPDRTSEVAESIVQALAKPFRIGGEIVYVSASIGITLCPNDATEMKDLLKHADQAMYVAKSEGRNRFSYFTPQMQAAALQRQVLIRDLRGALEAGQFEVYFQPIIDLEVGPGGGCIDTPRVRKAEALLRWHHPARGMVSPAEFIPVAEETGMIHEIGDWVFREAVRMAGHWNASRTPEEGPIQVSVNKSPRQFFTGDTHETWIDYLHEAGLPPECIVIEITEGLLLENHPEISEKLAQFRDSGVQVALDDFGTGYSSMSYLKRFDIDYLKIDQTFVRDMESDPGDLAIIEAIIAMAHKLGLKVIAEGVETPGQRDLLLAAGCDHAQGYLFGRPAPAAELRL